MTERTRSGIQAGAALEMMGEELRQNRATTFLVLVLLPLTRINKSSMKTKTTELM